MRHKLMFRLTRPGSLMPGHPDYTLHTDPVSGSPYLLVQPESHELAASPKGDPYFTVENPVRLKHFLEIQLHSAEALKLTNEKINEFLSDDTIAALGQTVQNTEQLTARATTLLDNANELFDMASQDLKAMVATSDRLAVNLTQISQNLNDVIGDDAVKEDVRATLASLRGSTEALNGLLQDPALQETLTLTRDTSKDAAELVHLLRQTAEDRDLQQRLDRSLDLMNHSLDKLSVVLDDVHQLTASDDDTGADPSLQHILAETRETSENLKQFSKRLNGRFLLFRLMF